MKKIQQLLCDITIIKQDNYKILILFLQYNDNKINDSNNSNI